MTYIYIYIKQSLITMLLIVKLDVLKAFNSIIAEKEDSFLLSAKELVTQEYKREQKHV